MGASIISIFDREGYLLGEVEAQVEREWLLNEYGEATFALSKMDSKCTERMLRFGNRVLIQSNADDDAGVDLPDWVGVIDPPREWGERDVTVTAYSAEYMFTWRRGPGANKQKVTRSWGGIFERLIEWANAPEDLYIRAGDIFEVGPSIERTIEVHEMYNAITGMVKDSGQDWGVEPVFSGGRLLVAANWWERRGLESAYMLEEGKNLKLSSSPLSEQGPLSNDVLAYSNTMVGWNPNRVVTVQDAASIARYGLRQMALSVDAEDSDKAAVKSAAGAELKRARQGRRIWDATVVTAEAIREVRLGNTYPLRHYTSGFYGDDGRGSDAQVRVIGMLWSDADQELRVNIEEVTE